MLYELWSVWDSNNLLGAYGSEEKASSSIEEWSEKLNVDESAILVQKEIFYSPYKNNLWFTLVDGVIEDLWPSEIEAIEDRNSMIASHSYDDCIITIDKIPVK